MVPFDFGTRLRWEKLGMDPRPLPGLLAIRHAIAQQTPGVLWVDSLIAPRALILVRDGDGEDLEVFGTGRHEAAVAWLIRQKRPFAMAAPDPWFVEVAKRLGRGEVRMVETWLNPGPNLDADADTDADPEPGLPSEPIRLPNHRIAVRSLGDRDADAFVKVAPAWALRGWQSFGALIENGAAFGVPQAHDQGFAAVAWIFDRAAPYASVGVFTQERFRQLGLGRAVANKLVDHIRDDLALTPLWSADANHSVSLSLAASLGFHLVHQEAILRWPSSAPRRPAS